MTITGSQLSNSGSGTGQSGNASGGATAPAIRRVSGAASNADRADGAKSQDGDNAVDETAEAGKGEKKDLLSSANFSASRLGAAIKGGVALSILPPGLFPSNRFNPIAGFMPGGFGGVGGSGNGWNGAAIAGNRNPNYNGTDGSDPAPGGGYAGPIKLFEGTEKPKNVTVLGGSNSGSNGYGDGTGTAIANAMSARINRGESLGLILTSLDGSNLVTGNASQTPHLTATSYGFKGSGLTEESYYASSSNKVTGTGIIFTGPDGSGQYHVGTEEGTDKMAAAMRAMGLQVKFVTNEAEYEGAIQIARSQAEKAGGKQLLWVHGEAHGNSNRQDGRHSPNDIGFVQGRNGPVHEFNFVGRAAEAHKEFKDVLLTTGACHSGAIDAHQAFEHLDQVIRQPVPEKEQATAPDKADKRTSSVDQSQSTEQEPKKEANTLMAERSDEEKRKQELENRFQIEIA